MVGENLSKFIKFSKIFEKFTIFFKFCEKIFINEIFCFLVIMSKKASADQFSVSGGNLGPNRTRKTGFLCGKDFFLGGPSYKKALPDLELGGLYCLLAGGGKFGDICSQNPSEMHRF